MNRRKFMGLAVGGSAAATLAGGNLIAAPPTPCPNPPGPFPKTDEHGRQLIVPSDTPDRFKAKIMEFNPIVAPDPEAWELEIRGLVARPITLRARDLRRFHIIRQSSRMKCVQCWSTRIVWEGFRCGELLALAQPKAAATHVRLDCADKYYDYLSLKDLMNPRVLLAIGMNGEPLTPEHGAPLRIVIPYKYGYKSSKLITRITLVSHGGQGVVADTWPYYTQNGDIEPGYDHPFDFPGETRKIKGGEIMDY
jgi:sulfoxide reductase catalytic subunit YedY